MIDPAGEWHASLLVKRVVKMPKETRQITFTNNEVIDALREFCHLTDRKMPSDQPAGLSFANDAQVTVYINHTDINIPPSSFTQTETAIALIKYCNNIRIPIQRKAIKWLEIKGNHLVLLMKSDT